MRSLVNKRTKDKYIGKIINNYVIDYVIGEGQEGTVYHATKNNEEFALKKIHVTEEPLNEAQCLYHLCNKYVLCLIEEFTVDQNYWIVTKFIKNYISLSDFISKYKGTYSSEEKQKIIHKLKKGLQTIHDKNYIHGDINGSNILINPLNYAIKYIDFGRCFPTRTGQDRDVKKLENLIRLLD